jgi:serine protease Do
VPQYETQYERFFNFNIPSRVQNGTTEQQIGAGTGFLVSSDGYIVTNKHVVDDSSAKYTVILNDENHKNEKVEARIVAIDPNPNRDIAILKIEKTDLPHLNLGDSSKLQVGQTAVAIGYALGEFDNTVSKGVISGLNRSITASGTSSGSETLKNLIQTDAPVNSGNSGGPLLDISGQVIGVNVAMADAQSIGFAIPINDVKTDYEQAKSSGSIKKEARAFLGVRYMAIDASVKQSNNISYDYGVIVSRGANSTDLAVTPGSPADKAGIVENDIILEVGGTKVDTDNPLADLIGKYKPGDQVKLKISHRGEEKEVTVTLSESS